MVAVVAVLGVLERTEPGILAALMRGWLEVQALRLALQDQALQGLLVVAVTRVRGMLLEEQILERVEMEAHLLLVLVKDLRVVQALSLLDTLGHKEEAGELLLLLVDLQSIHLLHLGRIQHEPFCKSKCEWSCRASNCC